MRLESRNGPSRAAGGLIWDSRQAGQDFTCQSTSDLFPGSARSSFRACLCSDISGDCKMKLCALFCFGLGLLCPEQQEKEENRDPRRAPGLGGMGAESGSPLCLLELWGPHGEAGAQTPGIICLVLAGNLHPGGEKRLGKQIHLSCLPFSAHIRGSQAVHPGGCCDRSDPGLLQGAALEKSGKIPWEGLGLCSQSLGAV